MKVIILKPKRSGGGLVWQEDDRMGELWINLCQLKDAFKDSVQMGFR